MLVKVAEKVLPNNPDWEWHVYGDGETFETIKKQINSVGLEKQLILKGNVPGVCSRFCEYAIFVLPSYREGLPLVLLEAKINKLPMISFDIETGPSEIIDKENGILIEPYDCNKMAEEIQYLIDNVDYRCQLSEGTSKNLEKFDYNNILQQWCTLINEMCGEKI